MYPNSEIVTFMVRGKNQFIELGSTYSNNKYWAEQFFYIFGSWEVSDSEDRPLEHSIPQEWGVSQESYEYLLLLICRVAFGPHIH
jgi:hypothetical protein